MECALLRGQGLCYQSDHFYVDTFEWLTLKGLSSRHIKVSSIYPLLPLSVLIDARKMLSLSLWCLWAAVQLPGCPAFFCSSTQMPLLLPWLRLQRRTTQILFLLVPGCQSFPGLQRLCSSHRHTQLLLPAMPAATQQGQQPNPRTLPGCPRAGQARGPQELVHRGLCFQPQHPPQVIGGGGPVHQVVG